MLSKKSYLSEGISLGIAVKKLLQTDESLEEFMAKYPHYVDLQEDLKKGYQLWESVYSLLRYQESKGEYNPELSELFKKANEFVGNRFTELGII